MTPSQMYQVNRPALERSTSASGSWADRRQPPTAAKYRNLLPDENEDVPELEHELDDAEPDFELEEEWVEHPQAPSPAAPGLAFCACMHPCSHRVNNRRSSSSIGAAARPSPVQSSYSYSFDSKPYRSIACPTLPIIVADVPLPSSSAGPSPSLGPTGLTFARRSSSTAGGPPTSSRSSGSFSPSPLPPLSSQLPPASIGWMSRSMSVQHQKSFAHAGSKSNTRDFSSPDPTHDSSDALPSAPLPFTGISRKRSCTGPPPPLTPFSSSMNTAASTNVAAGAIAHHHHTHRRQTSGSSLNSPNAYGSGYGYRNLSQLPVPPVHYPTAGRSPIVTPSLFQSTPLPQAEFRKPPIASSSSSSFVSLSSSSSSGPSNGSGNNPDADHCSRNRSFTGPSINATPSPRYPSTFGEQQGVPSPSS
ncbi:hypothetical protein CF335_g2698 [Tilletia laevis]|nr:hypothetical protein CF335_g2698 [Tilletia laevis]